MYKSKKNSRKICAVRFQGSPIAAFVYHSSFLPVCCHGYRREWLIIAKIAEYIDIIEDIG